MRFRNESLALAVVAVFVVAVAALVFTTSADAGSQELHSGYKVLAPITHDNLTIFPVVSNNTHDTGTFLTLDEGLRSGEVVVTESGRLAPLIRPRLPGSMNPGPQAILPPRGGARVNQLVLVNNSKRPLILLAGEVVTGGKQDRVIGKDRIVPPESDPIDLDVFCVEPGRWIGKSDKFSTMSLLVQPSVRAKAMADKNQAQVWSEVGRAQESMAAAVSPSATAGIGVGDGVGGRSFHVGGGSSSYASVMDDKAVHDKVSEVAAPVQHEYSSVMKQLRDRNAVGVVVAVNGEIVWADLFASPQLLEKYWPKLVRSYAAEALTARGAHAEVDQKAAQEFLEQLEGTHEVSDSEPGVYRQTEISGGSYEVFELTSLLPKTGFQVHVAKMKYAQPRATIGHPAPAYIN